MKFELNISDAAMAILTNLNRFVNSLTQQMTNLGLPERSLYITTQPLYNGREKAICIKLEMEYQTESNRIEKCVGYHFGDNRNSDSIFLTKFTPKSLYGEATMDDITEKDYKNRQYFDCYGIDAVTLEMIDSMKAEILDFKTQVNKMK